MSGVAIAAALLGADAPVLALVPAAKMKKGVLPKGILPPCLLLQLIGTVPFQTLKDGRRRGRARVRVTVRAADYDALETILNAVRDCLGDRTGAIAGCIGVSILVDAEGTDFVDPATGIFERSQDFRIFFTRAA